MTKKNDTVKAAQSAIRRDTRNTPKEPDRTQGALVDRHVRQHTPEADKNWGDDKNNVDNG